MVRSIHKYRFNYFFILFWFILVTLNFLICFTHNSLASNQVALEWNPNSEPDLAGYRVYSREKDQPYNYDNPHWEGTDTTCTIYNLDETKTYRFVARAYNTKGFESGNSNEVYFEPGTTDNQPPISDAGPDQTVDEGQLVTLDGSNSTDPDDEIASYRWVQTSDLVQEAEYGVIFGAFETFSDPAASGEQYVQVSNEVDISCDEPDEAHKVEYTFDVPEAGAYLIKGWVHSANGADDSFWVRVNDSPIEGYLWDVYHNTSYQADYVNDRDGSDPVEVWFEAGENIVTIYLRENGTRLDKIELEPLKGFTVTLSDPGAKQPTFTAPDVGVEGTSFIFELTVVDHSGLESTDSCVVNTAWVNELPEANAGFDQTVDEGVVVTLDGSSSFDIDDGIASYYWNQISGPEVILSSSTSFQPTFTAPDVGLEVASLKFSLAVTDFGGLQSTANCFVFVTPKTNEPPTANAGEDKIVYEDDVVILDGSNSSDPDGEIASRQWIQISGTSVTLSDLASTLPTFIAPDVDSDVDILTFSLTVTDNGGLQGTDTCGITVNPSKDDVVTIISATYSSKPKKLRINATSDAPAGSLILTAWANYGTHSVNLGNLKYLATKKAYGKAFRRINSAPDTVTVTSSKGGSDTEQCIIK